MNNNLRTRIAAAISKHYPSMDYDGVDGDCYGCDGPADPGWEWEKYANHLADAVIAELGPLVRYWDNDFKELHYCRECGGWGPKDD